MKKQISTLKDIARHLGVSVTTVSKALRGQSDISQGTRDLVLKTAQEMNYSPNPIALSLVKRETRTLGVIIPSFTIPFYASVIGGVQKMASEHGYQVMICQSDESYEMEVRSTRALIDSRVDGLIVSLAKETTDFTHFRDLLDRRIPLVLFNRVTDELTVPKVTVDDYQGAYEAVTHLIDNGYQRIAHIAGPKGLLLSQNRLRGYQDALEKAYHHFDETLVVESDFTIEGGKSAMRHLLALSSPPDALFAVCDSSAFGAMSACKDSGFQLPHDMGVVGFTDEPMAAIMAPTLTTVSQPTFKIGELATELLISQITSVDGKEIAACVLPTQLIIRESSLPEKEKHLEG